MESIPVGTRIAGTRPIMVLLRDHTLRQMISEVLQTDGYTVTSVADPTDLFTHLSASTVPAVVLLDPYDITHDMAQMARHLLGEQGQVILLDDTLRDAPVVETLRPAATLTTPFDIHSLLATMRQFGGRR